MPQQMKNAFFVRIDASEKFAAAEIFGEVEWIEGVVDGEIGFVTGEMTEKEFDEKKSGLSTVKSRIRVMV